MTKFKIEFSHKIVKHTVYLAVILEQRSLSFLVECVSYLSVHGCKNLKYRAGIDRVYSFINITINKQ